MDTESYAYAAALEDFREAQRRAVLQQMMARVTGKSAELLSFNDIRAQLKLVQQRDKGLQEIPLSAIVGSVARYQDYTRDWLPRSSVDSRRWARVKAAFSSESGVPPIDVYQLGDAYFVNDGNHRVSAARQMGNPTILARVIEIKTRVPLTPDDDPDTIIRKARYAHFLDATDLDQSRPHSDVTLTVPGGYDALLEHISVHRYFMLLEQPRPDGMTLPEAAVSWHDKVYQPVVEVIRRRGVQRHFPAYTEADLYLIIKDHRAAVEASLGWEVDEDTAAVDLVAGQRKAAAPVLERVSEQVVNVLTADEDGAGGRIGVWRSERSNRPPGHRLFQDILVAGRGIEAEVPMLDHALTIARRESGRLLGLHVVADSAERRAVEAGALRPRFETACRDAGVPGSAAVAVGNVPDTIVARAGFADLVVLRLAQSDRPSRRAVPSGDFDAIVQRSPCPVLAVPDGAKSTLDRALVAFDGSPKAFEALYVAAYLAGFWGIELVVAAARNGKRAVPVDEAQAYLAAHQVTATIDVRSGPAAEVLLESAESHRCNLLIMGSFGFRPVLKLVLGSTVYAMLRAFRQPVLICR